jgi:hypothetical protein
MGCDANHVRHVPAARGTVAVITSTTTFAGDATAWRMGIRLFPAMWRFRVK